MTSDTTGSCTDRTFSPKHSIRRVPDPPTLVTWQYLSSTVCSRAEDGEGHESSFGGGRVPCHSHVWCCRPRETINSVTLHYCLRSWWKGCISTESTPQDAQAHFSIWAVLGAHVRVWDVLYSRPSRSLTNTRRERHYQPIKPRCFQLK